MECAQFSYQFSSNFKCFRFNFMCIEQPRIQFNSKFKLAGNQFQIKIQRYWNYLCNN